MLAPNDLDTDLVAFQGDALMVERMTGIDPKSNGQGAPFQQKKWNYDPGPRKRPRSRNGQREQTQGNKGPEQLLGCHGAVTL